MQLPDRARALYGASEPAEKTAQLEPDTGSQHGGEVGLKLAQVMRHAPNRR